MMEKGAFRWRYWRVQDGRVTEVDGAVAAEEPLRVIINGQEVAVLMRSPGQEKELAVGFCVGEGLIRDFEAIQLLHHCGSSSALGLTDPGAVEEGNRVEIRVEESAWQPHPPSAVGRLIRSSCSAVALEEIDLDLPVLEEGPRVSVEVLLGLRRRLHRGQAGYAQSGGVHAAAVFDAEGRVLAVGEDVGRHNAVDKVVGTCLIRKTPLHDKILLSTGRASYDMVVKAVRVGIPIVITISSPTSLAVRLADLYRCTLVGYLRSKRLHLYTGRDRLIWPKGLHLAPST
jgi:FdhD protein